MIRLREITERMNRIQSEVNSLEHEVKAEIFNPEDGTWEGLCAIHNALAGVQEANKSLARALRSIEMGVE